MRKNKQKYLRFLIIALSVLASLKMIFFAVGLDEEYQIVMSYRNAAGDRLFAEMLEPHQASAFLCSLLMRPYLQLFGTTGIVLYLRGCGTLLHLGISIYLYKVLGRMVPGGYAWTLAVLYYNIIPKQIITPEFGMMQVWFYTLCSLFLIQYYKGPRKVRYLAAAALALVFNVLSYPSCLILYPFILYFLFRFSGKNKWRDMGVVTAVCAFCAAAYLGMLFSYTTPAELFGTLSEIVDSDVTHTLTPGNKLWFFVYKGLYETVLWIVCFAVSAAVGRWKKLEKEKVFCLTVLPACAIQLVYWLVLKKGYEAMHIHLIAVTVAGLACCGRTGKKQEDGISDAALLRWGIWGAVLSLLAVVYLTDISLTESIPHAMPAAIYAAALLVMMPQNGKGQNYVPWVNAALTVLLFTAIFGKGFLFRAGYYNNILQSGGIMKEGPAWGTISDYMGAYIYNCDYEDWQAYLQDGDRVLIMVDQVGNLGTMQYLFKDVEISHYSVVNPTGYGEKLLEYWEEYPGKSPNVIIVDCWYGQLMAPPDGWMMNYIENDFGYTQVIDGRYIRIYRR